MKRKCLSPKELAYFLLISSVVTGCTQKVDKLPDYQKVLDMCKNDASYCEESEKIENVLANPQQTGATGSYDNTTSTVSRSSSSSFLNHYLLYHMLFSNNNRGYSNYNTNPVVSSRIANPQLGETKKDEYSGRGVYSRAFVTRMNNSISEGKTSFTSESGKVYKSSQFAGSTRSSITGKSISRGGLGSSGRSFGVSS